MSSKDNPCRKFQANIFNKSKCQNCFKPRESHLLTDEDLNQAKPIYGGWLLLAPEGTNFDNPLHRSRKWQRRFFILYEHGLLRYALDEMASTLPQGTINMNQCSDVIDGEARTGQKNSLCILTPDKEHFIRAESKEIINGWLETLVLYPRTNKQNQKKKRKVEPPTPQGGVTSSWPSTGNHNGHFEPGPAKVTATSSVACSGGSIPCLPSSIAAAERVPATRSLLWQEDRRGRATIPCSRSASCISQLSLGSSTLPTSTRDNEGMVSSGRKTRVESGYFSLEKAKPEPQAGVSSQPPPLRYSSSDTEPLTSPDSFLPSQPLGSEGSSAISSSQSSLDSEGSCTTVPDGWEGTGGGGAECERVARRGRGSQRHVPLATDMARAKRLSHEEVFISERKQQQQLRARPRSPGREEVVRLFGQERRRSRVIEKFESLEVDNVEHMETSSPSQSPCSSVINNTGQRQGRSERRHPPKKQELSLDAAKERCMPDVSSSAIVSCRRAKSLDRRVTESSMTPDLLNFKKGWMTKLYEEGLWKKHWFVLTDQSLRYYRDSIAEEAADLDGEIDLSTCYDVTEFPVQRNYGFQIHTTNGAFTLSAMTSGIRRNWIQAIMKNVRPAIAPDVTRKNVSLKLSVLKTSSLPEEKARIQVAHEISSQPSIELHHSTEGRGPETEVQTRNGSSAELRRNRIRDRRREGRSKTFDFAEFRHEQPEKEPPTYSTLEQPVKRAEVTCASSSGSSATSSPVSSISSGSSSTPVPLGDLGMEEELERERARRREERVRRRFLLTQNSAPVVGYGVQEQRHTNRMEVDRSLSLPESSAEESKPPNVQVEIEHRWHQVENTPLREEKQVPIATLHSTDPTAERLPPQELAALLDKELEQTQKELTKLQEQNSLLQDQLQQALEREHTAREGYVLQNDAPSTPPHTGAWQRLHKLNQDLQSELEAQRRKQDFTSQQVQALRRNYNEAKDVIRHHEAEIQALQTKLNNALAEILISEQAVAKMRTELKLEQERFRDHKDEWDHNEKTLRAQLKDSEDRLKDVEAHLLEKSQALRDLERQQALQRDHLKEVQKLQERLTEVTSRLIATEEAQTLKEERIQKSVHTLQESHEKERQCLVRRLTEAEGRAQELEERLQEAEQQVEGLLRESQSSGLESSEMVHQLEEQLAIKTDAIEKLTERVQQLEDERDQLTNRCQELLNQITEADNEVTKLHSRLKTEETDYYNLEHSYEKVTEEFQKISTILREKEGEIRETKEIFERLVEKKEQDLNEAMIKMAALGTSLEETELKLQVKQDLLSQMGKETMEPCAVEKDLQAKLIVAEDRIAELERNLNDLQLGYSDLQMEHCKLQEDCDVLESMRQHNEEALLVSNNRSEVMLHSDSGETSAKRQRIRFSSIHCQKYVHIDGQKLWPSSSSEIHQNQQFSEENSSCDVTQQHVIVGSNDHEKFISIIQALETKLFFTEKKLQDITLKLGEQQGQLGRGICGEINESLSKADGKEVIEGPLHQESSCYITAVNSNYEQALACVELSRKKVQALLNSSEERLIETHLHVLSEIEMELVNATLYIRQGAQSLEVQQNVTQKTYESELSDEESVSLFAKTLAFESLILSKMAYTIQNPNSNLLQSLDEIHQEAEKLKRSDESYVAVVYADVLTRKLMIECEFWAEVEKLEAVCTVNDDKYQVDSYFGGSRIVSDLNERVISNVCIKGELAFAVQSLKSCYEEKLQNLKDDITEAHSKMRHREQSLKDIIKDYTKAHFDQVLQDITKELTIGKPIVLSEESSAELAPYVEQIKMEEAHEMAEEMVNRHLHGNIPFSTIESLQPIHFGQGALASELKKQAEILQLLSQKVENAFEAGSSTLIQKLAIIAKINPGYKNPHYLRSSSLCLQEAMIQAQIVYVACKLRTEYERELELCKDACQGMDALCQEHTRNMATIREQCETSLQDERQSFTQTITCLQEENEALKGEVSCRMAELSHQQERLSQLEEHLCQEAKQLKVRYELELSQVEQGRATTELALMEKTVDSQQKLEIILMDIENMEDRHEEHVHKLENKFHGEIHELQKIHEEEIQRLHCHYTQTLQNMQETLEKLTVKHPTSPSESSTVLSWPMEQESSETSRAEMDSMLVLRERIQELETQMNTMKDELENKHLEGDVSSLKEKYQKDFENLKATCERGFAAMEETHQKVIEDIQRQHQREVAKLLEERERLLAEETAATIAAIEAMKNAHREEMEKTQRSQLSGMSSDIEELHKQYEEELQSVHRELEVLSEQYSQKCLENAHLAQALEAERQALRQCQRENQELNAHNQELNNRLTVEITRMRSCFSGEVAGSPFTQGKDLYELEVLLRIKESEIQYLKQEIHSLKDELQSALRDKKYATDKYKDIYTELSIVKAKADCDISKLKEQLMAATEALGERSTDSSHTVTGYDIMKSKSNPDFLKARSSVARQIRGTRSKSVIEQVAWDS